MRANASFKIRALQEVYGFEGAFLRAADEDVDDAWRFLRADWTIHYEPT